VYSDALADSVMAHGMILEGLVRFGSSEHPYWSRRVTFISSRLRTMTMLAGTGVGMPSRLLRQAFMPLSASGRSGLMSTSQRD